MGRDEGLSDSDKGRIIMARRLGWSISEMARLVGSSRRKCYRPQYRVPSVRRALSARSPQCTEPSVQGALSARSPQCRVPSVCGAHSARSPQCTEPSVQGALSAWSPALLLHSLVPMLLCPLEELSVVDPMGLMPCVSWHVTPEISIKIICRLYRSSPSVGPCHTGRLQACSASPSPGRPPPCSRFVVFPPQTMLSTPLKPRQFRNALIQSSGYDGMTLVRVTLTSAHCFCIQHVNYQLRMSACCVI